MTDNYTKFYLNKIVDIAYIYLDYNLTLAFGRGISAIKYIIIGFVQHMCC